MDAQTSKEIIKNQEAFFNSYSTLSVDFRIEALKKLKQSIKKYEQEIIEALHLDLGKSEFEAFSSEIGMVQNELTLHLRKLRKWARTHRVTTPLFAFPSTGRITRQHYGKILIISPFNFPFMLALTPLIGAVSSGNVVVLKPSEFTPHSAAVIGKILAQAFSEKHVAVVQGGVDVSRELLTHRWDKIFFTGSPRVGKIVLKAAAEHLTPVVLELGGENPVVVDKDANLKVAARRIVWGKLLNAGQSCVAPDYLFVHREVKDRFLKLLVEVVGQFFTDHPLNSSDFSKIVSKKAVQRLSNLLEGASIYFGGEINQQEKYFSPTILTDVSPGSPVMQEEIFGPVLPVLTFEDLDEVVRFISKKEKPLALYYFSENRKKQKDFLKKTYSGDAGINEVVMHFTNLSLPFGGVGYSGMGSYHGKHSFEVFSHERSVMKTTTKFDLPLRYPPYKRQVLKLMRFLFR